MNVYLKDISKKFDRTTALDCLSLCFEDGKLTALTGPSGCGKTTILNVVSGVLRPTGGNVFFGERCVTDLPLAQRNIGYVFQDYALYPNMTAYDNLKFPLTNRRYPGLSRAQKNECFREKILEIARLLQIEAILDRHPSELSGGQQQRVALGRAIIREPDILLMDEPFANLDRKLALELRHEIRRIQQHTGITTVFVTHNQADASAIADRIVVLNKGTLQQEGLASELYDFPANLFVADFFGEYGSNIVKREQLCGSEDIIANLAWPEEQADCVSFRPEDLSVATDDGPFCVADSTRFGNLWLYRLESKPLQLMMLSPRQLQLGGHISAMVDADRLNFFDVEGRRLSQMR